MASSRTALRNYLVSRSSRVPSDVPGIRPSGSSGLSPAAPVGPVVPTRALTRVAPVAPRAVSPTAGFPLGRSGVELNGLLGTIDQVTARRPTPAITMEVGLEQARGSILRNLGGDALAALDSVWEGARRTEEGWYLRSGALTLLGLPGESDRVADEGLASRPDSLALRFMQSCARLALGDLPGARAALNPALSDAPTDPLLLVQHAIVMARQGDQAGAETLLQRVARFSPDHPAVEYGRAAVRLAMADAARSVSRATPPFSDVAHAASESALAGSLAESPQVPLSIEELFAADNSDAASATTDVDDGALRSSDVVDSAMRRIGARLASGASSDVAREVRVLVRAFSAGGTMVTMGSAEQAHSARVLLTTLLGVFTGESTDASAPLRTLLQQLAVCVREGRAADAERLSRKAGTVVREPVVRLLQSLVRGAVDELTRRGRTPDRVPSFTPSPTGMVVRGLADPGAVVPVRLGLALLGETPTSRAAALLAANGGVLPRDAQGVDAYDRVYVPGLEATGRHRRITPQDGLRDGVRDANGYELRDVTIDPRTGLPWRVAEGWGGWTTAGHDATATAEPQNETHDDMRHGAGARIAAVLCVAAAAGAMATGHNALAVAMGAGAAWMALRRSGRDGARDTGARRSGSMGSVADRVAVQVNTRASDHQSDQQR